MAALTIAQCDSHGALGGALANNMLVELGDDLARRQLVEREILFFSGSGKINGHE